MKFLQTDSYGIRHLPAVCCLLTAWLLIGLTPAPVTPASEACPYQLPRGLVVINGHALSVEIAHTPDTRACGLSKRRTLPENAGMLFVFARIRPQTFWMKDTLIPLSIAFLNASGKIVRIHDMQPDQTHITYPSGQPVQYALEVNQGWFDLHAVEAGDTVVFDLPGILKTH